MSLHLRRFAPLALAALAAACAASPPREGAVLDPKTPLDQFRAEVVAHPQAIRLAIHARGVSAAQADALTALVEGWRAEEGGAIRLQAPAGGPDPAATYRMGESVRAFLIAQGVPAGTIELTGYDATGLPQAPIVVGYTRYEAVVPTCGRSWENLSGTRDNAVSGNFGCAVTANLAAQTANPADLVAPRDMDPADAARRVEVLGKYRAGEITSTAPDDQAKGTVSQVVR